MGLLDSPSGKSFCRINIVISNVMLMVRVFNAIVCIVGAASSPFELRPNLRGNNLSTSALHEIEFVADLSSMNSSMFDETRNTNGSLQNSSSGIAGELESE